MNIVTSTILLCLAVLPALAGSAAASVHENDNCLGCHGRKTIADKGEQLYVNPAKFAATTHAIIGCTACHDRVSPNHPDDGEKP